MANRTEAVVGHGATCGPWRHLQARVQERQSAPEREVLWLQADLDACFDVCEEAAPQRSSSQEQKGSAEASSPHWRRLEEHNYLSGRIAIFQPTAEKIKAAHGGAASGAIVERI